MEQVMDIDELASDTINTAQATVDRQIERIEQAASVLTAFKGDPTFIDCTLLNEYTCSQYGGFILVCDPFRNWICRADNFAKSLASLVEAVIVGSIVEMSKFEDDPESAIDACYFRLAKGARILFSSDAGGPSSPSEIVDLLFADDDVTPEDQEEVCDKLGIDLASIAS